MSLWELLIQLLLYLINFARTRSFNASMPTICQDPPKINLFLKRLPSPGKYEMTFGVIGIMWESKNWTKNSTLFPGAINKYPSRDLQAKCANLTFPGLENAGTEDSIL